jgi:aspartyl protease family protein
MALAYSLGVVALVSTALLRLRRGALAQHLRHAAIWIVIVAVLALAYAFAGDLQGVSRRLALAFSAGDPVRTAERELVIPQDESGGYSVVARVDGHRVVFLVDTGASETVLSPDDARRLGVAVDALSYDYAAETANGVGYGAPYAAGALEVGPIRMQDFAMTINQAPMSRSLLGLSFLDRLKSFEVRDRKLILRW